MAERLDSETPFPRARSAAKYDWGKWLDGSRWRLVRGKDFAQAPENFRRYAQRVAGERHGKTLRTHVNGDTVVIQAVPR